MDDKLNALDKLIEAVEAGEVSDWAFGPGYPRTVLGDKWEAGMNAYCGSLDAALALHEALLPGQDWCIAPSASYAGNGFTAKSSAPARAWLLAVLKAYRGTK